jgi:hypothetical protein
MLQLNAGRLVAIDIHLDIVFESSTCVMKYSCGIIQWIIKYGILGAKGQIMNNMTDIDMA